MLSQQAEADAEVLHGGQRVRVLRPEHSLLRCQRLSCRVRRRRMLSQLALLEAESTRIP